MLAALIALLTAQAATGPHPVGWRDLSFSDPEQGRVFGRVYYPAEGSGERASADTAQGPYPLVAQLHGWLGSAWMYDEFCLELASWGFVVAATDTETGLNLDMETFAWDTLALIEHVEDQSFRGDTALSGLADGGDLSAVGHSMGGATLARLVEIAPRLENLVAMMPYEGERNDYQNLASFTGSALYIAGSEDETSLPSMVEEWFEGFGSAQRALHFEIEGAGHQAVTDFQWNQESMDDQSQLEAVQHLATRFLRAEVLGDEWLYRDLIGPGSDHIPGTLRSRSQVPAIWAELDDAGQVTLGVAGALEASLDLFLEPEASLLGMGSPIVADVQLEEGLWHGTLTGPTDSLEGLYLQGQTTTEQSSRSTRVIELVAGMTPSAEADPEETPRRNRGCDASSRSPMLFAALVALGMIAKRRNSGLLKSRGSATLSS